MRHSYMLPKLLLLFVFAAAPSPTFAQDVALPATFSETAGAIFIDSGAVKVGIDKRWGGAIREIWFEGRNVINNHDGGRLMGVSMYDGSRLPQSDDPNDLGWNATPSDMYDHTNPPLAYTFDKNVLYVRSQLIQWYPKDKGGGRKKAVPTDVLVETWISFVGDDRTVRVRYRVIDGGREPHTAHDQEFPFVYVRTDFNRFVTYSGDKPWTNGEAVVLPIALDEAPGHSTSLATERWSGVVDGDDVGLLLWAPQNEAAYDYEWFRNGGGEDATIWLWPHSLFEVGLGEPKETTVFALLGAWQDSRSRIYSLRDQLKFADITPPRGYVDVPQQDAVATSGLEIAGWAIDDRKVERVEVSVDGAVVATAEYGEERPDVATAHPEAPGAPHFGYSYILDTAALSNGKHFLQVNAVDASGNNGQLSAEAISFSVAR